MDMPMVPGIILTFVCALSGLMLLVVGRMMRAGTLPPNTLAGIRTARAFESTEAWYEVQRKGSTATLGGGVAFLVSAALVVAHLSYPATVTALYPLISCIFSAVLTTVWTFVSSRA